MNARPKLSGSDWRDGFVFIGNDVCLDFVNTRLQVNGDAKELLTDWTSLIRWFRAAGLLDSREGLAFERFWAESKEAQKTLTMMWSFRENLRRDLLAWEAGARLPAKTIHELNELMSGHPMLNKIVSGAGKLMTIRSFRLRRPTDLFAPLAEAAAHLFAKLNSERVRRCEHCALHFHDTSKVGSRRWCSMRLCGNRAKVAAYAERHK